MDYSVSCEQRKKELWQVFLYFHKKWLIFAGVSLIFAVYFMLIGFLEDKEAFTFGIPLTVFLVIVALTSPLVYRNMCKLPYAEFKKTSQDGVVIFSMKIEENNLVCKNRMTGNTLVKPLGEIKGVIEYKDIFILQFPGNKNYMLVPKNEVTIPLISSIQSLPFGSRQI